MLKLHKLVAAEINNLLWLNGDPGNIDYVIEHILRDYPNPVPIKQDNGSLMKLRGCSGPCCCIGSCQELIPFSELDQLSHDHYKFVAAKLRPLVAPRLKKVYLGKLIQQLNKISDESIIQK